VRSKATVILSTIVLVLLLVLVGGILFLKSDYAANRMCNFVRNSVQENLGLSTTIGSCSIDLLPPTLVSRQVQVETPDGGRLLDVGLLQVELDSLALLTGRFRIGKVFLQKPEIYLSIVDGAIANLPKVKKDPRAGPAQESTLLPEQVEVEGARLNLLLDKKALLQLRDMQARWVDKGRQRYELNAEIGGGSLDLVGGAGASYNLKGCKLKAGLNPSGIRLDRFFVEMGGASIDARGTLHTASGQPGIQPDLNVRVVAPLEHLSDWIEGLPPMQGTVEISAQARAAESGLQAEGDLEIRGFSIASAKDINLKARLQADTQKLKLQNLWISGPAGQSGWTLSGGLQLDLQDPWEYRGSLSLERVGLKDVFTLAGLGSPPVAMQAEGTVGFRGKLKGKVGAYVILASRLGVKEFSIPLKGEGDPAPPVLAFGEGSLRVEAAISPRRVRFPSFRLEVKDSVLEGEGKIYFKSGATDLTIRASRVDPADFSAVAGYRIAGECTLGLGVSGSFPRPVVAVNLEARDLWVEDRRVGTVNGRLSLTADSLQADGLTVAGQGGRVQISGTLGLKPPHALDVSLDLGAARLSEVFAIAGGRRPPVRLTGLLAGNLKASGSLQSPVLDFRVSFAELRVGDQLFEEGGAVGRLERGAWRLDLLEARMGPGWLFARGEISKNLDLNLAAYSTGLRAASFAPLKEHTGVLDFRLDLNVSVKGSIRSPSFAGWAKLYDTRLRGRPTPDSHVSARATTESFHLSGRFFGEATRLEADVKLEESLPFTLEGSFSSGRVGRFFPELASGLRAKAEVAGSLSAKGRLLSPKSIKGELRLLRFRLQSSGIRLKNKRPVVIRLADYGFSVQSCEIVGTKTVLSLKGGGGLETGADLTATGTVGLGLLPLLGDFLHRSVGKANMSLNLRGPWADPRIAGTASFSADLLRFKGFPQDITAAAGELQFTPRRVELTKLRGKMGGGVFTGQGRVDMEAFRPTEVAISFDIDRARYNVAENLWGIGSGVMGLTWTPGKILKLYGDLKIREGEYSEHISLVSLSDGIFRRRLSAGRTYAKEREVLEFDIRLRFPDRFQVSYNLDLVNFRAESRGELRVVGTNERAGLVGEMEALSGTVTYLTKDFEIQSTRVQFLDRYSIRPRVEVYASLMETIDRGEEGSTDYYIRLHLTAEGDTQPEISLRSEPPLDEHDIVTLLHLGVTSRDVESFKGEDLMGLGGEILFRSFKLDQRLRRLFPFPPEVVQAKYLRLRNRFSENTKSSSPRLEVGAKLRFISDELDMEYSRSLFDDTDQSLDLSYKLSEGISTRLRWENTEQQTAPGDIGDLGLDLKFQWEW
jgi:autotransporter translocation and assembly factor TamB